MLYENLHVLNILTKGTLRDTLSNREWRLVLALMTRESYRVRYGHDTNILLPYILHIYM